MYLKKKENELTEEPEQWNLSVVSKHVNNVRGFIRHNGLTKEELQNVHWMVLDNCVELRPWISLHEDMYKKDYPNGSFEDRIASFHLTFVNTTQNSRSKISKELKNLALQPMWNASYLQCTVNGVKWVAEERDRKRVTQNSGVMQVFEETTYYGILLEVIELKYANSMPVVVFKCKWFDESNIVKDRGLISINTNTSCYQDAPFILAIHAQQVFYIDDPKRRGWKVVNHMFHRGIYKEETLARDKSAGPLYEVEEPYQEHQTTTIPTREIQVDMGNLPYVDLEGNERGRGEEYEAVDEEDQFIDDNDSDDQQSFNDDENDDEEDIDENIDSEDDDYDPNC